ncbi:nitroreductase family protein [Mycolicibacterium litorale]|uniref:NAD(P)H nitroreductase n=1 Tax=Mycolicibacterium litorale TaxID=758802 RepID=A0AAD1II93_9MYCO|nr:nitroreductase family protein [Mycolicibacterium litorale]MCV7414954.1 nitroreductase family protein [Mycolicibacterium litorale]TDY08203.1 nitroreductase family protein [Mycolicibacterium litorale]BBY16127.1 putative NAD(P)H nitroreductase [Mycolicibacterium litorale]
MRHLAGSFPDLDTLERALDIAARAPSAQNAQPWRWRVTPSGVDLFADWTRRLGDGDSDRRDVLISCGAVLHHCAVAVTAAGWAPRVHRFPDRADGDHLALIELIEAPPSAADLELAAAIGRRRADRRPYRAESLPAGSLEMLHVRAERDGLRFGVVPKAHWGRSADGEVALQFGRRADAPADEAVLLVLGTESDTDLLRVRAGEVMSDLMLAATSMGLASCPLTMPLSDTRDRLALACEVFDGEAYPQTLIRVGWAPDDGNPPPMLERRSVPETTEWLL